MNLVIFRMADKEYGADLKQVRQVIRMREVTPVPDAAGFVEGVISLKGRVVPLINLYKKMGLTGQKASSWNRIMITELEGSPIGVLVDTVSDVISIEPAAITAPDDVLKDAGYLSGVARLDNRLVLVVDMEKLLGGEDRNSINEVHKRVELKKKGGNQ